MNSTTFLDWNDRPKEIQFAISGAYETLTRQSTSAWGVHNGDTDYNMCGVKEYALMKKIILQNPERKDFYALDIGCGNFQWSAGLSKFIEEQTDLAKDITVHIFGIRGESYFGDRVVETDRCKIYSLGAFKVEELFAEFKKQKFDLENKTDLAVTRWCFRHLADPVGTLAQVYNLLRPQTGFFLFDGFFFLHGNESMNGYSGNPLMTQLILDTKAPFLSKNHGDDSSLNHFILQRANETPCQLPLSYVDAEYIDRNRGWQIGSNFVTRFKREPQEGDKEELHLPGLDWRDVDSIYGDKKIYEWLKQNGLFYKHKPWKPMQNKDKLLHCDLLHDLIRNKTVDDVQRFLINGKEDINESGSEGQTALHLCIELQKFELFQYLLDQGAMTELENNEGYTSLILAATCDTEGSFLQVLIDKGADVNRENSHYWTPLDYAIKEKNPKAIEILLQAGAKVTKKNSKDLAKLKPSRLHSEPIVPTHFSGLNSIYNSIKQGDCVVLHYDGTQGIMYHYPNSSNETPKLIYVNINWETNLLNESEWPDFLRLEGYEHVPFVDQNKIPESYIQNSHFFKFGYGVQ